MNHLNNLLKIIEIELRSNIKLSKETWIELSELSSWDYQIVQSFINEVNIAINQNDLTLIHKKFNINNSPKQNRKKYDLLIACLKRSVNDLVITDVVNRLVIPEGVSYKQTEIWGMDVDKARNFAVDRAFKFGCKYILFIDDDMIVENTAFVKLWETINKTDAICVAADYQRKADYEITAHGQFTDYLDDQKLSHLKETDLCAMGFTLIDLEKLSEQTPLPYFWIFTAPDGLWSMGEDAFFTKNMIEYTGQKAVIDTRPSVLHYDKIWKRIFGKRDKSVTYATGHIETFEQFDYMRQPPQQPLLNICIPTRTKNDPIATNFDRTLCLRGYKTEHSRIFGKNVDEARNNLATNSVKLSSKYTLFVDNDVILPENAIVDMLTVLDEDTDHTIGMVVGDYLLKGKIPHSVSLQLDKNGLVTELNRVDLDVNSKTTDCNWLTGLGCALIRTEVFRQVRYPYFMCFSTKLNKIGIAESEDGGVNEDAYFCEQLFNNGYKVKILNDLKCIHVNFETNKMYGYDKEFDTTKYACFDWIDKIQYIGL